MPPSLPTASLSTLFQGFGYQMSSDIFPEQEIPKPDDPSSTLGSMNYLSFPPVAPTIGDYTTPNAMVPDLLPVNFDLPLPHIEHMLHPLASSELENLG